MSKLALLARGNTLTIENFKGVANANPEMMMAIYSEAEPLSEIVDKLKGKPVSLKITGFLFSEGTITDQQTGDEVPTPMIHIITTDGVYVSASKIVTSYFANGVLSIFGDPATWVEPKTYTFSKYTKGGKTYYSIKYVPNKG